MPVPNPVTPEEIAAYREQCLNINRTDLMEEMAGIPAAVGFWGERFAVCLQGHALAKLRLERKIAELRERAIVHLQSLGAKVTEDAITSQIVKFGEYAAAVEHVSTLEYAKSSARAMVDAAQAKWEMLVNMGAQMRTEIRADSRSLS